MSPHLLLAEFTLDRINWMKIGALESLACANFPYDQMNPELQAIARSGLRELAASNS